MPRDRGGSQFELRSRNINQPWRGERDAAAALPGEGAGNWFESRLQNDNKPRRNQINI